MNRMILNIFGIGGAMCAAAISSQAQALQGPLPSQPSEAAKAQAVQQLAPAAGSANSLQAEPGKLLYREDFKTGKTAIAPMSGTWEVTPRGYQGSNGVAALPVKAGNCVIAARITVVDTTGTDPRIGLAAHGFGRNDWNLLLRKGMFNLLEEWVRWRDFIPYDVRDGTTYCMKMRVQGRRVSGKVWLDGTPEPTAYQVSDVFVNQSRLQGLSLVSPLGKAVFHEVAVYDLPDQR